MLTEMTIYLIERSRDFTTALSQHLTLTFLSLGISVILGLFLGILSSRIRWLRSIVLTLGNLGRTLPSLAVLALALPILGIGTPPTILALVFIGTLPIMINTNVGIEQVDDAITEAARGMGMNDLQVLLRVEIPIATSVIMAGIRTSAVIVVASATLAGFIGGGGLGDLILRGHALGRDHIMLAGALPATLLAFYFEEMFGRLERWATPKGLKIGDRTRQGGSLLSLLAVVTLLPLVFGAMLPWETFTSSGGDPVILTGLHPEYRAVGLPALLIGLVVALWPRTGERGQPWPGSLITFLLSAAAFLWTLIALFRAQAGLPAGHQLQSGMYIQSLALGAITVITVIEMALGLREGREAAEETGEQLASAPAT
jgi:osmoprotectant transport system permease protein